jgi:hypothetical protein
LWLATSLHARNQSIKQGKEGIYLYLGRAGDFTSGSLFSYHLKRKSNGRGMSVGLSQEEGGCSREAEVKEKGGGL